MHTFKTLAPRAREERVSVMVEGIIYRWTVMFQTVRDEASCFGTTDQLDHQDVQKAP